METKTQEPGISPVEKTTAIVETISKDELAEIETVVQSYGISLIADASNVMTSALLMAEGIAKLESLLTPKVMEKVMSLQGTRLGFKTDKKDGQKYELAVVKRCFIESTLNGFMPVGNEFNIIASNFYGTKEGYTGLLKRMPEFTDFKIIKLDIAKSSGSSAIVEASAEWKYNGNPGRIDKNIPVKINQYQGPDAILGKAERKLKHAIYHQITGSATTLPEGSIEDVDFTVTNTEPVKKDPLKPGKGSFGGKSTTPPAKDAPAAQESQETGPKPEAPEGVNPDTGEIFNKGQTPTTAADFVRLAAVAKMFPKRKYEELDQNQKDDVDELASAMGAGQG